MDYFIYWEVHLHSIGWPQITGSASKALGLEACTPIPGFHVYIVSTSPLRLSIYINIFIYVHEQMLAMKIFYLGWGFRSGVEYLPSMHWGPTWKFSAQNTHTHTHEMRWNSGHCTCLNLQSPSTLFNITVAMLTVWLYGEHKSIHFNVYFLFRDRSHCSQNVSTARLQWSPASVTPMALQVRHDTQIRTYILTGATTYGINSHTIEKRLFWFSMLAHPSGPTSGQLKNQPA